MSGPVEAALLGVGAAGIYALLAHGLVVVYRGSGVLNFAHGAFAMVGAYLFYELRERQGWSLPLALVAVVLLSALLGMLVQVAIMHPMRRSAPLARVVATIGLLITLEAVVNLRFGPSQIFMSPFLPQGVLELWGVRLGQDRLVIFGVAIGATVALWALYRFTGFGRATQVVAENQRAAAALGHSPVVVGAVNWALGCGLAGLAGSLIGAITGLEVATLSLLVVPAIAAAVGGRFASFPLTLATAVALGVAESMLVRYVTQPGWGQAVPFLAIVGLIVFRGRSIPLRDFVHQRLPVVDTGRVGLAWFLVPLGLLLASAQVLDSSWTRAIMTTAIVAILGISVVMLTGYAGQLSLAAYALAGIGGLAAARVAEAWGLSMLPAAAMGAVVAVAAGILVALPALRTRGIDLAVVTMGLAVVVQAIVFESPTYAGGVNGIQTGTPSIFGWEIDTTGHLDRFASVAYVALFVVILMASNVRRGSLGRRMLAVRDNERAAASVGIGVQGTKLYAFALSAFIASVAGVLMVFQTGTATFGSSFGPLLSLMLAGFVVLGSVGYRAGSMVGALLAPGALGAAIAIAWFGPAEQYLPLIGGLLVVLQLVQFQDGIVAGLVAGARKLTNRKSRAPSSHPPAEPEPEIRVKRVPAETLKVEGLSVRFGNVTAVDSVSFEVAPGEIVGLIGPNGAGKTTIVDGITGFVRADGRVSLGGNAIENLPPDRRANHGLARSFQSIELFDDLTVAENLSVATDEAGAWRQFTDLVRPKAVQLTDTARAAVRHFGLEHSLALKPERLSFARRRLVGIARVVAKAPSVVLLDEAAAGLDRAEVEELSDLLRELANRWGMGVLLIEHHLEMVVTTCDRILVLDQGRILFDGTPAEAMGNTRVREAYMGERRDVSNGGTQVQQDEARVTS